MHFEGRGNRFMDSMLSIKISRASRKAGVGCFKELLLGEGDVWYVGVIIEKRWSAAGFG